MAILVSAPSLHNRFAQLLLLALLIVATGWFFAPTSEIRRHFRVPLPKAPSRPAVGLQPKSNHPIDHLISEAGRELQALLDKQTDNIHDAARAYRERRGRQPPPGFDLWFNFAQNHSAVLVEDFWDQIYNDLNPFWGVPAQQMREQANVFPRRISVRKGEAIKHLEDEQPWINLWHELTASFAQWLPDVDMAINIMDESRMVVPWEEMNEYMAKERQSRRVVPEDQLKDAFQSLKSLDEHPPGKFDPEFNPNGPYWPQAVVGCAPDSPARKAYIDTDFTERPPLPRGHPERSYLGYVQNFTFARSPCDNPHLQGLHGSFIEPVSISNTKKFFPLFGGSKLPMNNEILLPAAMYYSEDPFYSGGKTHGSSWEEKQTGLIWRGAASGGRNREENWMRFQRHRFVSMVNATTVRLAEAQPDLPQPPTFDLPIENAYDLAALSPGSSPGDLSKWMDSWSDASFVHLICFPNPSPPHCAYTDSHYSVAKPMPMKNQYSYKYLPDVDGNSFSGRYRGFLGSTSLPIKATVYNEWHDSRLMPWKHFIPMDNTFVDIYGIMEYFVGNADAGVGDHDDVGQEIALGGKAWAEKVLRKEDMQIYVFRLLLEYARLCDDDRETMGWREGKTQSSGIT